ncbi:MAG: DUF3352 domain-containing protein [Planctomycetes bacterium]|nr:DUF3352 domain-containing protein [Planctomycetota bacterium]
MRRTRSMRQSLLVLCFVVAAVWPAWGEGLEDFKLARAIPADVFMAVHARTHEGQAFVQEQFERVWEALENAHFEKDLKRLFKSLAQENQGDPEEFEQWWQQIMDLLAGVEWSTLGEREFAFALKLEFPAPQWIMLMRPPQDKVASDFAGFGGILRTLAELAPDELVVATDERGATTVHKLTFANAPFPLAFAVARHEDVLVLAFGTTMVEQTLAMLEGGEGTALCGTPRFKEAFKQLPAPIDSMFFLDVAKLMTQMRAFAAGAMDMVAGGAEGEEGGLDPQIAALPGKVIDALDMFEYIATVARTDGKRTTQDSITVLRDDAKTRPLYPAFFGNGPISDPLKYIPQDAKDVTVWSGFDFAALYGAVVKFIAEDVPNGADMITQWNATQEEIEFNVERDLLAWLEGGIRTFKLPGRTPYSPGESVLMITVRDEEQARAMINKFFDWVEPHLAQQNGAISPAEIEGVEGFRSVLHPMLALVGMSRPTIGVADGLLFVGSSPKVITQTLAVAAGKAPSFAENERFKQEGLPPSKNVTSLSFTDLTNLGEELGQMLSMIPMIGMMGGQQLMQQNPALRTVFGALSKVGTVVRKLDFFQSTCSQCTFDGKTILAKTVTNYREPPKPTTAETETETETETKTKPDKGGR